MSMDQFDTSQSEVTASESESKAPRGRPFQPGESGNPNGRPKGARNKSTVVVESLLEGEAEALTRKAVDMALEGNMPALRLCLERVLPPKRERSVVLDLPKFGTVAETRAASETVLAACADGTLSPSEAMLVMDLIARHAKVIVLFDLEKRIEQLETERARREYPESSQTPG